MLLKFSMVQLKFLFLCYVSQILIIETKILNSIFNNALLESKTRWLGTLRLLSTSLKKTKIFLKTPNNFHHQSFGYIHLLKIMVLPLLNYRQ